MPKKATPAKIEDLTFEQAFEELEATVAKLEDGDLSLEESLALFERGQRLSAQCSRLLEQAELKVTHLVTNHVSRITFHALWNSTFDASRFSPSCPTTCWTPSGAACASSVTRAARSCSARVTWAIRCISSSRAS